MTDDRQARLLAEWLQQEPGSPPPPDLDPEAVEAVYALRPDLAPAPSLDIEDVLAEVASGPLAAPPAAAERDAAAALVAWLEAGEAPPADVDPEVLEAVYALRPDLAPAPSLGIEDILGEVAAGPLAGAPADAPAADASADAGGSAPQPTDLPDSTGATDVDLPSPANRTPARRHRRLPPWALPGLGAVAVAATALLFVVPRSGEVMDAPSPFAASETLEARQALEAEPAPELAREQTAAPPPTTAAAPAEGRSEDDAVATRGGKRTGELADGTVTREDRAAEAGPLATALPEEEPAAPLTTAPATTAPTAADAVALATGTASSASAKAEAAPSPTPSRPTPSRPTPSRSAPADRASSGGLLGGDIASNSAGSRGQGAGPDVDADELLDELSAGGAVAAAEEAPEEVWAEEAPAREREVLETEAIVQAAESKRSRRGLALPKKRKEAAAPAPAAAPAQDPAPAMDYAVAEDLEAAEPAAPAPLDDGLSLDQLRATASSFGALPDVTAGRPDVAAAHALARAADTAGDSAAYLDALRPLLGHADADVARDAAWRIARRQTSLGQLDAALATTRQGLDRGSRGPLAARLYVLQGELAERRGDTAGAAAAYRQAIAAR